MAPVRGYDYIVTHPDGHEETIRRLTAFCASRSAPPALGISKFGSSMAVFFLMRGPVRKSLQPEESLGYGKVLQGTRFAPDFGPRIA
jgi:hypothetical protein